MSRDQRSSRDAWIIAIGVVALLAVGVGVALRTQLLLEDEVGLQSAGSGSA